MFYTTTNSILNKTFENIIIEQIYLRYLESIYKINNAKPYLHTPILSADKKTLKFQAKSKQKLGQNL